MSSTKHQSEKGTRLLLETLREVPFVFRKAIANRFIKKIGKQGWELLTDMESREGEGRTDVAILVTLLEQHGITDLDRSGSGGCDREGLGQLIERCVCGLFVGEDRVDREQQQQAVDCLCATVHRTIGVAFLEPVLERAVVSFRRILQECSTLVKACSASLSFGVSCVTSGSLSGPLLSMDAIVVLIPSFLRTMCSEKIQPSERVWWLIEKMHEMVPFALIVDQDDVRQLTLHALIPSFFETLRCLKEDVHGRKFDARQMVRCVVQDLTKLLQRDSYVAFALDAFVQCLDFILEDCGSEAYLTEPVFLLTLRRCLLSPDGLVCKRAFFVLERMWMSNVNEPLQWHQVFRTLYSSLDEFGLHLVQQEWSKIDILHASAVGDEHSDRLDPEAHLETTQPARFHRREDWIGVLWRKGTRHKNPQVQRLVVKSFFEREWTHGSLTFLAQDSLLEDVRRPENSITHEFVVDTLVPCVASSALQSDPTEFDYQAECEGFLRSYVLSLTSSARMHFCASFLERVFMSDMSRQALKSCVALFAVIANCCNGQEGNAIDVASNITKVLSMVCHVHGTTFKLQIYRKILEAMKRLTPVDSISAPLFFSILFAFPSYFSDANGLLHNDIRDWIVAKDTGLEHVKNYTLDLLQNAFDRRSVQDQEQGNAQDIEIWKRDAEQLRRIYAFLMSDDPSPSSWLTLLSESLVGLYSRPYDKHVADVKILLLTRASLQGRLECSRTHPLTPRHPFMQLISEALREIEPYCAFGLEVVLKQPPQDGLSFDRYQTIALSVDCLTLCARILSLQKNTLPLAQIHNTFLQKCRSLLSSVLESGQRCLQFAQASSGNVAVNELLLHVIHELCIEFTHHDLEASRIDDVDASLSVLLDVPVDCLETPSSGRVEDRTALKWKTIQRLCTTGRITSVDLKVRLLNELLSLLQHIEESSFVAALHSLRILVQDLFVENAVRQAFFERTISNIDEKEPEAATDDAKLRGVFWNIMQSLWSAFLDVPKTVETTVATASLAFLPDIFHGHELDVSSLHSKDYGPVYWIVMQLLTAGMRSPRILLFATIRLVDALHGCPSLIEQYLPHITMIILHDSKDKGCPDTEIKSASDRDAMKTESVVLDEELMEAFQTSLVGPRVAIACFIQQIVEATNPPTSSTASFTSESIPQEMEAGMLLWDHLLNVAMTDELQIQTQYRVGSQTHRAKLRLWQILALCSQFVCTESHIKKVLPLLMSILKSGNISSVRMYVEMTVCCIMKRSPETLREYIFPLLYDYERRHESLPACMLIAFQVALSCKEKQMQKEVVAEVTRAVFPWCMTHNHATRAFAQLTIDALITHIRKTEHLRSLIEEDSFRRDNGLNTWPNIGKYLMDNKEMVRLKKGLGTSLKQLHAHEMEQWLSPQTVFASSDDHEGELIGFEAVPDPLIERIQSFLAEQRIKVRDANDAALFAKERGSHRQRDHNNAQTVDERESHVQRKITTSDQQALIHGGHVQDAWKLSISDLSSAKGPLLDDEDLLRSWTPRVAIRQSIIVVASLIDKLPNLAGLARTCEVFRADSLIVADRSMTKAHAFKSISVTAVEWLEIDEVKPVALLPWLEGKKADGYHLIGLEQTSGSQSMTTFQFPKRCVLLLGHEKEGIPVDLLKTIETSIEIPQLGVIRSLNVHVSGALAIYEYTRQHLQSTPHKQSPTRAEEWTDSVQLE